MEYEYESGWNQNEVHKKIEKILGLKEIWGLKNFGCRKIFGEKNWVNFQGKKNFGLEKTFG